MTAKAPTERRAFSRPLEARRVAEGGLEMTVSASEAERAGIAAELGLVAVGELQAVFEVERRAGGRFHVAGQVRATVTQACVVTLDPFESSLEQPVDVTFAPATLPRDHDGGGRHGHAAARNVVVGGAGEDEAEDPPDPMYNETIDLGVVASEFLALALDPYPRKPGVHFDDTTVGDAAPRPSPFAALEQLKARS